MIKELQPADPAKVGPYRLIGRLGAGGMGRVYVARSPGGRIVAIKVIRAELAEDQGFRNRFAQEVAAAQHVSGIFTAAVIDSDPDGETPWMATAYVPGPSLHDAVDEHGPLHADSALALAAGLAEGLQAIHRAGLVHRDLKPSNVLLAADGPRVIDFGISRALEGSRLTETGVLVGSPGFMSPEQALGQVVGPASDVFSLGAVLTFAATGEGPFGGGPTLGLMFRVVHESPDLTRVPGELRPLLEACLAKDPAQRPSPGQLLESLDEDVGVLTPEWLPASVTATFSQYVPASGPRSVAPPGSPPGPSSPGSLPPGSLPGPSSPGPSSQPWAGHPAASQAPPGPGPGTPGSGFPAPGTPAPVTSAPTTPAPVAPASVTPAPVTPAPVTPASVTPASGLAGSAPAWGGDTQATKSVRPRGAATTQAWAPGPASTVPGAPVVPPDHGPRRPGGPRKRLLLAVLAAVAAVAIVAGVATAMTRSSGGTHSVNTGQTGTIGSSPSPTLANTATATTTPTPSATATTQPAATSAPTTTQAGTWPTTQQPTSSSTATATATATATETSTPTASPSGTPGSGCSSGCSPTPIATTSGP